MTEAATSTNASPLMDDLPIWAATFGLFVPQRPPVPDDVQTVRRFRRWLIVLACFALALAIHALLGLVGYLAGPTDLAGGGADAAAINVELVEEPDPKARMGTPAPPPMPSGEAAVPPAPPLAEASTPSPPQPELAAATPSHPTAAPIQSFETTTEPAPDQAPPKPEKLADPKPKVPPKQASPPRPAQPQTAPRQAAPPPAPSAKTNAASAANRGEVDRYAKSVVAALAKTKPVSLGVKGKVVVTLVLSQTGTLRGLKITKSSGNPDLDRQALLAVRRTKFGIPPADTPAEDLIYDTDYTFE